MYNFFMISYLKNHYDQVHDNVVVLVSANILI